MCNGCDPVTLTVDSCKRMLASHGWVFAAKRGALYCFKRNPGRGRPAAKPFAVMTLTQMKGIAATGLTLVKRNGKMVGMMPEELRVAELPA